MSKFWSRILDGNDALSSKRLITLIVAAHFILASFVILFFATYVILYLPKGRVEPELLNALKEVLEYDFYIILSGLGFVTSEGVVSMIMNRNKNTQSQNPYQNIDSIIPYDPNNPSNIS